MANRRACVTEGATWRRLAATPTPAPTLRVRTLIQREVAFESPCEYGSHLRKGIRPNEEMLSNKAHLPLPPVRVRGTLSVSHFRNSGLRAGRRRVSGELIRWHVFDAM